MCYHLQDWKNKELLVSIIIPVYNAAKFIGRCLDSIISQSYKNLEIIIVNDGSKDESLEICESYAEQDMRIVIFNQVNMGVSTARNKGLDAANGEFISFIDADDYIHEKFIEELISKCADVNIMTCGYYRINDKKKIKVVVDENLLSLDNFYKHIFVDNLIGSRCNNKIFRRNIININNLRFNENVTIGEDTLFIAAYLKCCEDKFIYIPKELYYYYKNSDSVMQYAYNNHQFDIKKATILDAIREINQLYYDKQNGLPDVIAYRNVRSSLWLMFQMINGRAYHKEIAQSIRKIVLKNIRQYLLCGFGGKTENIAALFIALSPRMIYNIGTMLIVVNPNMFQRYLF